MRVDFVRASAALLLNREVSRAEAEQLAKELGNREELLAWLLLRNGAALEETALVKSIAAQAVSPFDRTVERGRMERSHAEARAMAALEEEIAKLIEADQTENTQAKEVVSALNAYGRSRPAGSPGIVDMVVRR